MTSYRLFETRQFQKDLAEIARGGQARLVEKLHAVVYPQLQRQPHQGPHVRKLKGYDPETWRYRIGAWRFFYEIDEAKGIPSASTWINPLESRVYALRNPRQKGREGLD